MKAEFIIKNVPILREGRSERRGEIGAHNIACIVINCSNKTVLLTHEGNVIGRIEKIRVGAKDCSSPAELRGDIVFTDFKELAALIDEGRFYPVAVTDKSTGIYSTYLVNAFFTTRDDCDFEDQQPLDLSELRELVNAIAKTKESDKGEDVNKGWTDPVRKPYIYAPGMSKEAIKSWLSKTILYLEYLDINKSRLQKADEDRSEIEKAVKRNEAFLAKAIRN